VGHRHSAAHLPALQHPSLLEPLPPFPMCAGSPRLAVLRRLRPAPDRSAVDAPSPTHPPDAGAQGKIRNGSRVHSDSLDEVGARLCPCGLAASTPQSFLAASLAAHAHHHGSSPPPHSTGTRRSRPRSTRFRAGAASRGCHTPVPRVLLSIPLAEPGPSGSTGPSRLCQGCSHPPRHHPDQAAPSSTVPLRRDQRRRSLTSTRTTAPHGARMTCGTVRRRWPWRLGWIFGWCRTCSGTARSC
jgi:hypothetical protein